MIAVDTNILVYAHRADSPRHATAYECMKQLSIGTSLWAIPWPCVHEFMATVTHLNRYKPPSSLAAAIAQMTLWINSPTCRLIGESTQHWAHLTNLMTDAKVIGGMTHDARIAAICLQHGVREFWTVDRDFSRFSNLRTRNPLN
jgi:uncharacterized protein